MYSKCLAHMGQIHTRHVTVTMLKRPYHLLFILNPFSSYKKENFNTNVTS